MDRSYSPLRPTGQIWLMLIAAVSLAACAGGDEAPAAPDGAAPLAEAAPSAHTLSAEEQAEGWQLLFDGASFDGWTGLGRDAVPAEHWIIEDGTIRKVRSGDVPVAADGQPLQGGDIMTAATYDDFEVCFDFKVSPGGNSGVKYNVSEALSTAHEPAHAALGFEYQILDDERHPDAHAGRDGNRQTAALYDILPADAAKPYRPAGEWNTGCIVFQGTHGEHWLNGTRVLAYDLDAPDFEAAYSQSKYVPLDGFRDRRAGHLVLQDHGDDVWYRNVKIRAR